jgi:hypothetical protein
MQPGTRNWLECWMEDHDPWVFSCSQVVCICSKTMQKKRGVGNVSRGGTSDEKTSRWMSKRHFWHHVRSSIRFGRRFFRTHNLKKILYKRFMSDVWRQSWQGQLWPCPVELGLNDNVLNVPCHIIVESLDSKAGKCQIIPVLNTPLRLLFRVVTAEAVCRK